MTNTYTIWHDADYDIAYWIYRNTILSEKEILIKNLPKNTSLKSLEKTIKNDIDVALLPMIKYEHPDIVITNEDGKAVCVTEFMTHTPQWQHPVQRFARIYGSVNMMIPSALIVPDKKTKLEKKQKGYRPISYSLSSSVKSLFETTEKISKTPTRIFEWGNYEGYLKLDKKSPTAPYIDKNISEWIEFINQCMMTEDIPSHIATEPKPTIEDFGTIRGWCKTEEMLNENNIRQESLDLKLFSESLVFEPNGLSPPSSYFRTDPYAGMLCAFDNMFCRDHDTGKRKHNLVLRAKNVKLEKLLQKGTFFNYSDHDAESCPFESFCDSRENMMNHIKQGCPYTGSKQQRIYGQIADSIIFDDENYSHGKII